MNSRPLLRMATAFLFLPPVTALPVRAQSTTPSRDLARRPLQSPGESTAAHYGLRDGSGRRCDQREKYQ